MPENPALSGLAASALSLPTLRHGQLAGMAALADGRDVLAVMPTGYGKSAIYQVAGVHLHRRTGHPAVVVSPRFHGRAATKSEPAEARLGRLEEDADERPLAWKFPR